MQVVVRDELAYAELDWVRMPDFFRARMQRITAADAMSREVVMIRPDATLDEIVQVLSERRRHRVLIGIGCSSASEVSCSA